MYDSLVGVPTSGLVVAVSVAAFTAVCAFAGYGVIRLRRRDNAVHCGERDHRGERPWPRRIHCLVAAVFLSGVAVYGSLVPLNYRPLEIAAAVESFKEIPRFAESVHSRADLVANFLLFVPLGFAWLAVLDVDRTRRLHLVWSVPTVLCVGTLAGLGLEFVQLWFPPRTVSQNDVFAQTAGSIVGVLLWLAAGQSFVEWIRAATLEQRPRQLLDLLLEAYLVGFLFYSVLPLDLTISPSELYAKYRGNKFTLIPLTDIGLSWIDAYGLVRDVLLFIPVGMFVSRWLTSRQRPIRSWPQSLALGGLVAVTIELAQVFVYSRYSSTTDVLVAMVGVVFGIGLVRCWYGRRWLSENQAQRAEVLSRSWLWFGVSLLYAVVLAIIFCAPFNPIDDSLELRTRYEGFFVVPFARLYQGSEFNAIGEVCRKMLWFAPLGAMVAMVVSPVHAPRSIRRVLYLMALAFPVTVSLAIEMAQVMLPPHVPDITDVILCTAGAVVGMIIATRFFGGDASMTSGGGSSGGRQYDTSPQRQRGTLPTTPPRV